MQAINMTNAELVARHLEMYESPGSKAIRAHRITTFLNFVNNKSVFTLEYDDFMSYFLHLKGKADFSFPTKQNYWAIVKSFIEFVQEYANKVILFPRKMAKWGNNHKKGEGKAVAGIDELNNILARVRVMDYTRFVELTLLKDAGMRPGELVTIKTADLHLADRYITTGTVPGAMKSGEVDYSFSEGCRAELEKYLVARKAFAKENPFLFVDRSHRGHENIRVLESLLAQVRGDSKITPHSFRTTINTLRKKMGCPPEDRKVLINHKLDDVNGEHYVKLSRQEKTALYDKWYPY